LTFHLRNVEEVADIDTSQELKVALGQVPGPHGLLALVNEEGCEFHDPQSPRTSAA
jgi:hypothetical protein